MKLYIKYFIYTILSTLLPIAATSCEDDLNFGPNGFGEGEATVSAEVTFTPLVSALGSRAVRGGTPGNAIRNIDQLWVVIFDSKGKLYGEGTDGKAGIYKITGYKTETDNWGTPSDAPSDSSSDPEDKNPHRAESTTVKATFTLPVSLPYGNYRMYAVANVDLSKETINSIEDLQNIQLNWNNDPEEIALNNQMFGYFTTENKSNGFEAPTVTLAAQKVNLRAWLKRAASKVTVAFDGSGLKENVWIFLKTVEIKDIPQTCYLGKYNPGPSGSEGEKGIELDLIENGQTITYHAEDNGIYTPESWPEYITNGHPIYGADPEAANNTSLDIKQRLAAQHDEDALAFYFYENMQGKGLAGTESDKHQQVNEKDKNDQVTSYPGGTNPDNPAWKDAKPYGTYIEVKAYYFSSNMGDPGQGEIVYRFMLGKDTHLDYNAERNHHYKLTMRFNGYANDVDWHIEYEKENRPLAAPNPYFISYLYNHSMMLPLEFDAGNATIENITAKIETNNWVPLGASNPATMDSQLKELDKYYLYWDNSQAVIGRPWNGFLSLRKTTDIVITANPALSKKNPLTMDSNKKYYDESNRGDIMYRGDDVKPSSMTLEEALDKGKLHVELRQGDNGNNNYVVHMPLWTRAKQLIKQSAFTGNNPYIAYQREAKIKVVVTLSDSTKLTTGLSNNGGAISGELISIRQVRRIVNPKGIYRSGGCNDPFHVVLKILHNEEFASFKPLPSQGPWRAYIMRDTEGKNGTISLTGSFGTTTGTKTLTDRDGKTDTYETIEGKTGSNIDFNVIFTEKTSDDNPRYAVIRVEYNNYTCYHLIFVRQGYGADNLLDGGAKWMAKNNLAINEFAATPLDEGSMFKYGKWTGIKASNNKNSKSPWTSVTPNDFRGNAPSNFEWTDGQTAAWNHVEGTNTGQTTGTGADKKPVFVSFPEQSGYRIAELKDYKLLYDSPDIELGYGVVYGDDSKETLDNINDVYGYMQHESNHNRGMRGCFVYNYKTGKNMFFPIGASGYGHRKNSQSIGGVSYSGMLKYACAGRAGYFDITASAPDENGEYANIYAKDGINSAPLFFDLFRRPGAIYWIGKTTTDPIEPGALVGWDINYFTFDFFPISSGNVADGKDACFVRSIKL